MIFYFSGTGNSSYIAHRLGELTDDAVRFITPSAKPENADVLGIVTPVYSWGLPAPVVDFLKNLPEGYRPSYVYAVFVCGDETGLTPEMLARRLKRKGLTVDAMMSVIMPNNYVLLPGFNVDSREVAEGKLAAAPERVEWMASVVRHRDMVRDIVYGPWPRLKTWIVYPLFRKWGIIRKFWHHEASCTRCGLCEKVCPEHNITVGEDGPVFGDRCVSCLSCYHHCPVKAIAYGHFTDGKGQYLNPEAKTWKKP